MSENLLKTLQNSFPNLVFKPSHKFLFHPPKTILFNQTDANFPSLILHEIGHAELGHYDFKTDIARLRMEVAAWEKARELAPKFNITIDENLIESELDTYRDWLHQKSKCKKCGLTRYQTNDGRYHCPFCDN